MIAPALAVSLFVRDFGGTWTCGNAHYHERWSISAHAGSASSAQMADIVYGDPASPDGFAYVYFVPAAHEWRYDDFHTDGGQSHLHSPGPLDGVWRWTGVYYAPNTAPDPNPVIVWRRTGATIVRTFDKREGAHIMPMGKDSCTPERA
jgi:hypothetical protein